jgi:hypothetical protein
VNWVAGSEILAGKADATEVDTWAVIASFTSFTTPTSTSTYSDRRQEPAGLDYFAVRPDHSRVPN